MSLALTLLVARSAFGPGYLLQVDASFGPKPPPFIGGFYAPIWLIEKMSVLLFGGTTTGRLYLFSVLFFAGMLPMVLLRNLAWWGQVFGGVLGILNPFIYDRLVEGQWTVIASCDGLFLWLICWELLVEDPSLARSLALAFATVVVVSFSVHFAGFLLVMAVACVIGARPWRSEAIRAALTSAALSAATLIPGAVLFFTGTGRSTASALSPLTGADLRFFRPTGAHSLGLLDIFGLYGYWGERLGRFPVATVGSYWWVPATGLLVALACLGAQVDRRRRWLLASGYLGVLVSLALATGPGTSAFGWLADHVAIVRGYRELEKWSALWLVALVVLGAAALDRYGRASRRRPIRGFGVALAFLAVVCPSGLTELRGAGTVLNPVQYPASWYAVSRYLARVETPQSQVMVLPWRLYSVYSFSQGRPIENPATVFFPGQILTSTSDQIPGDLPPAGSPQEAENSSAPCALAQVVRSYRAKFVVVEPAAGAASDTSHLLACGMVALVERPEITVLSWSTAEQNVERPVAGAMGREHHVRRWPGPPPSE